MVEPTVTLVVVAEIPIFAGVIPKLVLAFAAVVAPVPPLATANAPLPVPNPKEFRNEVAPVSVTAVATPVVLI